MKYALESPDISEPEKKQLRQVEHISKNIGRSFWVYMPLDFIATAVWFRRKAKINNSLDSISNKLGSQSHKTKIPLIAMFLTVRVVGMYHFSSEMSKKYLVENVQSILKKNNPKKD